jgi:hypothetical protein
MIWPMKAGSVLLGRDVVEASVATRSTSGATDRTNNLLLLTPLELDVGLTGLFWLPLDPEDESDVVLPSASAPEVSRRAY